MRKERIFGSFAFAMTTKRFLFSRVCNALALLQCVASHPETRSQFLLAHVPLFLYPFLHTSSKTRPFEYLRLTSLGVIGALVKVSLYIWIWKKISIQRVLSIFRNYDLVIISLLLISVLVGIFFWFKELAELSFI